jgi:U3 small nucleolar RNA-associated protein 6
MAGASDKARFYLEQSVPELKEYERRKVFTTVRVASFPASCVILIRF